MKNGIFAIFALILLTILIFLLTENPSHRLDKGLPKVVIGTSIDLDGLVRIDDEPRLIAIDKVVSNLSAVFILKPSCFHCDENLFFWTYIKRIYKNQLNTYGVILSDVSTEDATKFLNSKKLNFPLYCPQDRHRFMFEFNVKFNLSQTVILDKGIVVYSKAGVLEAKDFFKIKKITKEKIQNENET